MAMLSLARLKRYDNDLAEAEEAAARAVEQSLSKWRASHLWASTAEVRDQAIALAEAALDRYGDAACELSARLYDEQAEAAGADVDPAELPEAGDEALAAIERQVRYLAGRIADDGGGLDI